MSTKVYRNTNNEPVMVQGIGEIPPGEQVSITTEYQPPVILENYPGVFEVSTEVVSGELTPNIVEETEVKKEAAPDSQLGAK